MELIQELVTSDPVMVGLRRYRLPYPHLPRTKKLFWPKMSETLVHNINNFVEALLSNMFQQAQELNYLLVI